ncbi:LysR substrate-binding domain-containing protein [Ramlibacter algicola]|uniref:LysR family transcriptional regulator n=1 Tax=Ramlibacter algicola TaxID=2795217 RepID=A0A934PZ83_9BURK|nr:LysR substrate-binding domain-containing protein [Ramlibacter algicola]MBK0393290.1 LysR family transcriptional regulator [Ramlibacter algicola]
MTVRNLDMDVLRSFVALAENGTLASAADRVARTQAALSLQMRKLETQIGQPLFRPDSRKLVLNEAGQQVLGYARRILALNDEVQDVLRQSEVAGKLVFGASQDFGEAWLPPVLAQFRKAHPSVAMEIRVDGGTRLVAAVEAGEVDMALALGLGDRENAITIGHLPLVWIAHRDFEWDRDEPLPLALFTSPCRFRNKGVAALDAAGIPWHVALTSPGLQGVWAAVNAGLGITVRTPEGLLPELEVADRKLGLPNLGRVDVSLHIGRHAHTPAVLTLADLLRKRLSHRILELEARTPRAAISRKGGAPFRVLNRSLPAVKTA